MSSLSVTALYIYPLKGCGGIPLQEACIAARGFEYDRRWMLIDDHCMYLHQIRQPRLACVSPRLTVAGVQVQAPQMEPLTIPFAPETEQVLTVQVLTKVCEAVVVSPRVSQWFSDFLHQSCHLVYMPETTRRPVNPAYALQQDIVSFANGYPFHLLGQASLDALNQRLSQPLPMNRFRPNIVIAGAAPFAEDHWQAIQINRQRFDLVKPCDRCAVTMVDQATGQRAGKEPLKTLASFRRVGKQVFFGRYVLSSAIGGTVKVGDPVEVCA
ncbi:MAG TPA: MOSC N-terminal beta barrel domain-containing protein [Ktedonobacterales bacterium]|nr:MOSC N-terminal beta barrel domain-containing protein [Ktedonobacterales bacterium]